MNKKLMLSLTAAALGLSVMTADAQEATPKREFRSAWIAAMGIDYPVYNNQASTKQKLIKYFDGMKAANFTGVCLHVRPNADAYYKSTLEPWSQSLTGTRGKDPGWDPLAWAIEECHKRGLECYAWVNPFRVTNNRASAVLNTSFDKEWKEKGWLINGASSWISFNPGNEGARRHCLDVMKEIYTNYAIDGMLFDDYFYPGDGMAENSTADDWDDYKASKTSMSIADWRRANVNSFVKELYDEIQAVRPDMRFGIGPAGVSHVSAPKHDLPYPDCNASDWQYAKIYADGLQWLADGSIDFISPQLYWSTTHSTNPYEKMTDWWSMVGEHFNRHMYVSHASYHAVPTYNSDGSIKTPGWGNAEIGKQIDINRKYTRNSSAGSIYYNTVSLFTDQGLCDYIGKDYNTTISLVPEVTWKPTVSYDAVKSLANNAGNLTWTAAPKAKANAIVRYTVYAVPAGVSFKQAAATDGDGIDPKYLLGVSYDNKYTLPTDKRSGYWYAVCVYDGYGKEHVPALLNMTADKATAVTLISPEEGAKAGWDPTFAWSTVSDARYTLEIAADRQFTTLLFAKAYTTETSATIALDAVPHGSTCYWRVKSHVTGCIENVSEVRSFVSPSPSPAPKATLVSPVNGGEFKGRRVNLVWSYGDVIPGTNTIEVSEDPSFASIYYCEEVSGTETSLQVDLAGLAGDKVYWRVTSGGSRFTPTVSDVFSFTVVISSENDYVVKNDPNSYPDKGNIAITNLWYRATASPFENMEFDSNGSFNRGMAANADGVYVCGRSGNTTNADCYIDIYSPSTGQCIKRLYLDEEVQMGYYPCNDIITDSKGNVIITNLSLNISTTPVVLLLVNLSDGSLTRVASLSAASGGRVDHVGVYGDVTSGNFNVYAAIAGTNQVKRWTCKSGSMGSALSRTVSDFYPATVNNWGTAPRVIPVSDTEMYIDGSATAWTRYKWGGRNMTLVSSFADNKTLAPKDPTDNGGALFALGEDIYNVYSYTYSESGARWAIASLGNATDFATMKHLWVVPDAGLGKLVSSTCSAPASAVVMAPGVANVYVYSPGNGLAAYRVVNTSLGVDNIASDDNFLSMSVNGLTVTLSASSHRLSAYNVSGTIVASASDTDSITLPAPGIYVIQADGLARLVSVR